MRSIILLAALWGLLPACAEAKQKNNFDLSNSSVPAQEIQAGGPPRDGIPALSDPAFISSDEADWLAGDARIVGLVLAGEAKAYPIAILNWHEIVNDQIAGQRVVVTFCPLCGSAVVFAASNNDQDGFGVSGLLYNSDVLLYDRRTESLWSQIMASAISGPRIGERLRVIPSQHTTWANWRGQHPNSEVLSRKTGYQRAYDHDPYLGYKLSSDIMFPVANRYQGDRNPKERVLGLRIGQVTKAYPFTDLEAAGSKLIYDVVANIPVLIHYDSASKSAWVEMPGGDEGTVLTAFWFAWYAFYPETELYQP